MRSSHPRSAFLGSSFGSLGLAASLLVSSTFAPLVLSAAPAVAQRIPVESGNNAAFTSFSDIQGHWAERYIQALAARGIISGFPDGSFGPEQPVTRAQFAAIVTRAFSAPARRGTANFVDVSRSYWANRAIQAAFATGFMSGYPDGSFRPEQRIPRVQVLVSLANGLDLPQNASLNSLSVYQDADAIPAYAQDSIAAATRRRLVVNYPDVRLLNPNQFATRADVAAFVYQALASSGQVRPIASRYVVGGSGVGNGNRDETPTFDLRTATVQSGSIIPVRYNGAERIVVGTNEILPLSLTVSEAVRDANGQTLIPAGSKVEGDLRPAQGGSQFVAREITLSNGRNYSLNARSSVVRNIKDPDSTSVTSVLQDAVVGSAAAALISGTVVRDRRITPLRVISGTAAGALLGTLVRNATARQVVIINPDQDLDLRLRSDLELR